MAKTKEYIDGKSLVVAVDTDPWCCSQASNSDTDTVTHTHVSHKAHLLTIHNLLHTPGTVSYTHLRAHET